MYELNEIANKIFLIKIIQEICYYTYSQLSRVSLAEFVD